MTDFDQLGQHIAREQDALLAKHNVQAEVRARIADLDAGMLRKSAQRAATRRAGFVWAGGGVALAAAAVALISLRGLHVQPSTLTVQLADRKTNVDVGQYVQAPSQREVGLRFSDGSHIEVAERSRARLTGLRSNGADVSVESGSIHVQVRHRADTSWHIGAGPFGIHVIGTRFDVQWKPEEDSFELTLHEGQVELSGCVFGAGYRMLAGQTVRASCKNERFDVSSAAGAAAPAAGNGSVESFAHPTDALARQASDDAIAAGSSTAVQAQGSPAAVAAQAVGAEAASVHPKPPASNSSPKQGAAKPDRPVADWRALARAGHYMQALRAVRTAGFEQTCARASAHDLGTLAYAARYAQDSEGEAYAWRLLRERFRGTKDAATAAFALGRIEFDNHGAYAKAAEWFRTYLREQPKGDLAREALGRLLEATQQLGDRVATRELASRYLREYPGGPHASLAQRLSDLESD